MATAIILAITILLLGGVFLLIKYFWNILGWIATNMMPIVIFALLGVPILIIAIVLLICLL